MARHKSYVFIIGCVVFSLVACRASLAPALKGDQGCVDGGMAPSAPHAPISIQYDSALDLFPDKTGSGNAGSPYIIQNLEIDLSYSGAGIKIQDTSKYLVIRNCKVLHSGSNECGIGFGNCTNIRLENCTIGSCYIGVVLDDNSRYNTIHNNTIYSSRWMAILHQNSANNTISNNFLHDNYGEGGTSGYGMVLNGKNVTVVGNVVERNEDVAVYATNLANSTIDDNTINGTIDGASSDFADILLVTASNNSISGNHLGNGTCPSVILKASCNRNAIESNEMVGGGAGVSITNCQWNTVRNNTIWHQDYYGIYLYACGTHVLEGNDIRWCYSYGIQLYSSTSNALLDNVLVNNTEFGIYISTSAFSNYIARNIIIDNKDGTVYMQVFDACGNIYEQNTLDDVSDLDGDGLSDISEWSIHHTNRFEVDTDGDNFLDGYEITAGTDPLNGTDSPLLGQAQYDTLAAYLQGNATLIGIVLGFLAGNWTYLQSLNQTVVDNFARITQAMNQIGVDGRADFDADGLADIDEIGNGTNPGRADTDNDNFLDGYEVSHGSDPLDPASVPAFGQSPPSIDGYVGWAGGLSVGLGCSAAIALVLRKRRKHP